jgi:hypothetical protein
MWLSLKTPKSLRAGVAPASNAAIALDVCTTS